MNKWIISTGQFLDKDGNQVCTGYAGQPPHVNDPEAVAMHNIGPLPPGVYSIGQPQNLDPDPNNWVSTLRHMGPYIMALKPQPDEQGKFDWLLDRSAFYIHGDSIAKPGSASNGCVVPKGNAVKGDRQMRELIFGLTKTDSFLRVVKYPDVVVT